MFRVGTSFIFSKIKSRSASVTLNLICIVRFLPSMFSLLSVPRVWDTSQQAVFNRRAVAREGENTERVPLSYACYESFSLIPTTELHPILPTLSKRKTLQSQKRLQRFLNPIQFCRTHLICPLFQLRLSLLPLRSLSVCPYRSYHQEARQAAADSCLSLSAYLKGTGLRIYCNAV